jgi:hypothetical protein
VKDETYGRLSSLISAMATFNSNGSVESSTYLAGQAAIEQYLATTSM